MTNTNATANATVSAEIGNGNEYVRRPSIDRVEALMEVSGTKPEELQILFGNDIFDRIRRRDLSDAEAFDICEYMRSGDKSYDYRYILMMKDDWTIDVLHDPVPNPHEPAEGSKKATVPDGSPDAKRARRRSSCVKGRHKSCRHKRGREVNRIDPERCADLLKDSGMSFATVGSFLGATANSLSNLLKTQTFPEGTTGNLAWLFGTTPDYLEGKPVLKRDGASLVERRVMKRQNFVMKSAVLKKKAKNLHESGVFSDELITWMTNGDRAVSEEFAERVASATGVRIATLRSASEPYVKEPALVGTFLSERTLEQRDIEAERKKSEGSHSDKSVADDSASEKPKAAKRLNGKKTAKDKDSVGKDASSKCAPSEPAGECGATKAKKEEGSGIGLKEIYSCVRDLSDEDLADLAQYVESLQTIRSLCRKA